MEVDAVGEEVPTEGLVGPGGTAVVEVLPTKGTRGGASCLWVEVCSQGHRPQLEGIYWKPLVHTE